VKRPRDSALHFRTFGFWTFRGPCAQTAFFGFGLVLADGASCFTTVLDQLVGWSAPVNFAGMPLPSIEQLFGTESLFLDVTDRGQIDRRGARADRVKRAPYGRGEQHFVNTVRDQHLKPELSAPAATGPRCRVAYTVIAPVLPVLLYCK
jgi:hypothetical protein